MAADGSRKAIIAAFLANSGIAVAKGVGFAITGATSMLAEAVHSVADAANQGLLLLGGSRARREATPAHPFGYGRERYFWSFVVALVIFSLGSLFALFEGVEKLRHPHAIVSVNIAVGILAVAIVFEILSLRTAVVESRKVKGSQGWWAFVRHAKVPELPVVLLEDIGALAGLVLALGGLSLAQVTGNPAFDAYGTISIGLLLGVIAVVLIVEMKSLLIGEGASPGDQAAIRAALEADPAVTRVIHMRTQHLGPEELMVGAKVELALTLSSAAEVAGAIDRMETALRATVPAARVVYIEPDVSRAASA
ncbi:MAG: cation diffusion facilitator family transporter [Acidimicrobiales bacterium]